MVVPVDGGAPVDVGEGGEMTQLVANGLVVGNALPQVPKWSPDSQWIAYTAKHADSVQVWRSSRDGGIREQMTRNPADVQAFAWSRDGRRIYFEIDARQRATESAVESEADRGFRYDERFAPFASRRPLWAPKVDREAAASFWIYDIHRRHERAANAEERAEYEQLRAIRSPYPNAKRYVTAHAAQAAAWLEDLRSDPRGFHPPLTVVASVRGRGDKIVCSDRACTGRFQGLWIADHGHTVYFLRWLGDYAYGPQALYSWEVGSASAVEILQTSDFLDGCAFAGASLICGVETATRPKYIAAVSLRDSVTRPLLDLNSHFAERRFGEVSELRWQDRSGTAGFAHLVKPIGDVPGRRYPLVIVQYRSRGFLRGGVGDEYPIHVLAAEGFAVLSFDRPEDWDAWTNARTPQEFQQRRNTDSRDRRRVLSVLLAGIDRLQELGIVDPKKVAITGLSDGAETAAFALIHAPDRFAAAALSGIWWEPVVFYAAGPNLQSAFAGMGLGWFPGGSDDDAWRRVSLSLNAASIRTPILVQVSDSEILPAIQAATALRAHEKPVDLYVFPDEGHVKGQPRHRLNVYRRNVQWLKFWLQDVRDADPIDSTQYQRWQAWRGGAAAHVSHAEGSPTR
jgi:dipeptidyl aminopeptidase/acylaminoacyl peptidase